MIVMNVDDLLDPLRYQNLRDFTAANLEAIGGGVFTERDTLEHLRMLDLIAKAYQSVHLPTRGLPIPQTTQATLTTQTDTEASLLTAGTNETYEILSITTNTYAGDGLSAGVFKIYSPVSAVTNVFMDIPRIDDKILSFGQLIYGNVVDYTNTDKTIMVPSRFLLTGGESLSVQTKNAPSVGDTLQWSVLYRKVQQ